MTIAVLGAGAWGTAMAIHAATQGGAPTGTTEGNVVLWSRSAAQALRMLTTRRNDDYLPGVEFPASLRVTSDWSQATRAELLIVATPMGGLRETLLRLAAEHDSAASPSVVWLCKGFERGSGMLGHEIARETWPALTRVGVLSGPSFADEVARGQPTALVMASDDAELAQRVTAALHGPALRIYSSADPIGVEVGGAVKNVLAIATGLCDGLAEGLGAAPMSPGLNARAALVTRGLAEMTRLGVALGGRAETFMGLSGLGDLVLTATGALSRNRRVGLELAKGKPLTQVLAELGHVAEGVLTAPVVLQRAQSLGVDMPITQAVVGVLEGRLSPADGVRLLMTRDPRAEASFQAPPA